MWSLDRPLAIDPAFGDPRARALLTALGARDREAIRESFATTADADDHAFLMEVAATADGVQTWIGEWIAAEPEETLPTLIRGCHAVRWAWAARGGRRARLTRKSRFREFFRRLLIAETCLQEVTARDPGNATAWAWLTYSARGRQIGSLEAAERFAAVVDVAPDHVIAHEHRLQYLSEKWFGSHGEMFDFAREAAHRAAPGSLLPELLVIAHVEYWLSLGGPDSVYLARRAVRTELVAAAEQSILHSAFAPQFGWVQRANTFAMALTMASEYEHAARVFDLIGDRVTPWPWAYQTIIGSPARKFAAARREAYGNRR